MSVLETQGVHPAGHVGHFVEAIHDEIRRHLLTPPTRAADDEERLVGVELAHALGDLTH